VNKNSKGFTLLEVILAITILSTLSLLSTQAISRALKARGKIQQEVDDVSALRDSMRMIRTDINLAFHHRDFEQETLDIVNKPAAVSVPPGTPPPPAPPPPKRQTQRYSPVTHFTGNDTELNFVTLNSGRLTTANVQADFIEVGYSLKSCNNLTTGAASKCLFRRTQNVLDDDVKTGGNEIVMLENVTEFKLRYIGESKQDWVSMWDSTSKSSDGGTRDKFPDAIEVSVTIEREVEKKPRSYSMQLVVPVHFPNNSDKPASSAAPAVPGGSFDQ
jgi:prepilin-type N-terminal cleavage/methylation domain-containing protein